MNKAYIRGFKGLSYDKCPFNIEENASTLCQDVISTPKGALSSPHGSTKWNETSLGFINGLYDYRNRRGGQYIIDYYSTSGAGFGKTDYSTPPSSGGSTPTQTPDSSGVIDSEDSTGGYIQRVFTSIVLTIPAITYDGENFTITVTAYDQYGDLFPKDGTVLITPTSMYGTLWNNGVEWTYPATTITMTDGIATNELVTHRYIGDVTVYLQASISGKTSNEDSMATKAGHLTLTLPNTSINGENFSVTVTAYTYNNNAYPLNETVGFGNDGYDFQTTSLSMTNGVASTSTMKNYYDITNTPTVSCAGTYAQGTADNMTAYGYHISATSVGIYNTWGWGGIGIDLDNVSAQILRYNDAIATEKTGGTLGITPDIGSLSWSSVPITDGEGTGTVLWHYEVPSNQSITLTLSYNSISSDFATTGVYVYANRTHPSTAEAYTDIDVSLSMVGYSADGYGAVAGIGFDVTGGSGSGTGSSGAPGVYAVTASVNSGEIRKSDGTLTSPLTVT